MFIEIQDSETEKQKKAFTEQKFQNIVKYINIFFYIY